MIPVWTLLILMKTTGNYGGDLASFESIFLTKEQCVQAAQTIKNSEFANKLSDVRTLCYESYRVDVK